jgi:hypothetical protein
MLLGSKSHTAGNTKRWTVSYYWLDNAAEIQHVDVQSSSTTCTVNQPQILPWRCSRCITPLCASVRRCALRQRWLPR